MASYSENEFKKFFNFCKVFYPAYNHGRSVVVLREDSKKGQEIIARASRWEGNTLEQVYERPSVAKRKAFDECWNMYCNSKNGSAFGICSHNSQMFTISWVDENEIVYLTNKNEYHVICKD